MASKIEEASITYEHIVLLTMPLPDELFAWCEKQPEFKEALKIIYSDRFLHIGTVSTSSSPHYPNDEVIGIYAYDYGIKKPMFKQDFVINKDKLYKEFVLYTNNPKGNSKYVKGLKEFMNTYGKGGHYEDSHHLNFDQLPDHPQVREYARRSIRIAKRFMDSGRFVKPNQDELERIYKEILKIRNIKIAEK